MNDPLLTVLNKLVETVLLRAWADRKGSATIEDTAEDTTDIEEDIPAATIDTEILQIFQYYNIL